MTVFFNALVYRYPLFDKAFDSFDKADGLINGQSVNAIHMLKATMDTMDE